MWIFVIQLLLNCPNGIFSSARTKKKIGQKKVQALNQVNKTHLYDFLQQKKVKYNIQMNYFQLI